MAEKTPAREHVLDRSERPRRPRQRSAFRQVAGIGFRADPTIRPAAPFAPEQIAAIMSLLPENRDTSWTAQSLQDVAGWYVRARNQPTPSKSEASYELAMIAYVTFPPVAAASPVTIPEFRHMLGALNDRARGRLWQAVHERLPLVNLFEYLKSDAVDRNLVGEAAAEAWSWIAKGGDYPDGTLTKAVEDLTSIFEQSTGRSATWQGKMVGPIGHGHQRKVSQSDCGQFIYAFFDQLSKIEDPTVRQPMPQITALSNLLKAGLEGRSTVKSA